MFKAGAETRRSNRPTAETMAIKASGTTLGAMSESAGWVELDIAIP